MRDVAKNPEGRADRRASNRLYPWYDSAWLAKFVRAKDIIHNVDPDRLPAFIDAFRPFRTRPDFNVVRLEQPFETRTIAEIREVTRTLRPTDLEMHEARGFGRFVVHDHPFFDELQRRTVSLVSEAVGEPVDASYNFLSLYGASGRCPPHLDSPDAKWTLDVCIDQSGPWPIYISQVCPWPEFDAGTSWDASWDTRVKTSPALKFTEHLLRPGQAIIFSGSSQWHYRDAMPAASGRRFCDLLFFHFIPRGTGALVRPASWAQWFRMPELGEIV